MRGNALHVGSCKTLPFAAEPSTQGRFLSEHSKSDRAEPGRERPVYRPRTAPRGRGAARTAPCAALSGLINGTLDGQGRLHLHGKTWPRTALGPRQRAPLTRQRLPKVPQKLLPPIYALATFARPGAADTAFPSRWENFVEFFSHYPDFILG